LTSIYRTAAICAIAVASPSFAETLTNETVVSLVQAGLGDEAIIAKIKASANTFDVSTSAIIALKQRGISSPVLAAMIGGPAVPVVVAKSSDSPDPLAPHFPGVYLLADWLPQPKMIRIDPTTSTQTKTGGMLGYALTSGIASLSVKAVIPNEAARVLSSSAKPTFYLYVDSSALNWLSGSIGSGVTPNEFSLVQLMQKKGRREARVGSMNIGGAKAGVMDKDRIGFSYDQPGEGIYKISLAAPLPPGEYAFLYSSSAGTGVGITSGGAMAARVFDFSIK
jgi:hypothetical protein